MVDFGKHSIRKEPQKKIHPIEIYETLDRKNIAGPLRSAQISVLNDWFNNRRDEKDLIIKLHTGEGKTLIGLLILLSNLNAYGKPCLYLCPDNNLVNQTCTEAIKFGIPYCTIGTDREIPNDFSNGKKILITNINKLFNGKSKFGLQNNYAEINSIILDDSHACIDSIRSSFTITIKNDHQLYTKLRSLFEIDIREQGEGSYLELKDGNLGTLLPIPYWAWNDKKTEVLELLSEYKDEDSLSFVWPLVKNKIDNCQAFISGGVIEISPYFLPIHQFGSFNNAGHRILMSATTQDDSFFIKGLGFSAKTVQMPLINELQKWSGEKMILIPSLMHDDLNRISLTNTIAKWRTKSYGIVALVPSYRVAEDYRAHGSIVAKKEDIDQIISDLKKGIFNSPIILANRYDGIDLPDEACGILVLDGLPFFQSLTDQYEEECRLQSEVINIKYAQKIEQGLGRAVRGEKDYCVIILIGSKLIHFIKGSKTSKFFSPQTRMQIQIGLKIVDFVEEDIKKDENPLNVVMDLIRQSVQRDEKWKGFYADEMGNIEIDQVNRSELYKSLEIERDAEYSCYMGNYDKASEKIQIIIDQYCQENTEKGWFLQSLARYSRYTSKVNSNANQIAAYQKNLQLLKPKEGINYKKLDYINENRIKRIKKFISDFNNYEDLMLSVDGMLSDLAFGIQAEKFELALQTVGLILGFLSQRPDKEFKKGPDNLWCGINRKYIFFECKSSVDDDRQEISKYEAGQMNSHCGWFDTEYGTEESVLRILIIPTKTLSYHGNFTHPVCIMRKGKLKLLRDNIRGFIKELKNYNINEISDEKIQTFLTTHKLGTETFQDTYTETYHHKGH